MYWDRGKNLNAKVEKICNMFAECQKSTLGEQGLCRVSRRRHSVKKRSPSDLCGTRRNLSVTCPSRTPTGVVDRRPSGVCREGTLGKPLTVVGQRRWDAHAWDTCLVAVCRLIAECRCWMFAECQLFAECFFSVHRVPRVWLSANRSICRVRRGRRVLFCLHSANTLSPSARLYTRRTFIHSVNKAFAVVNA